jgi:sugar phosphate isomerase/epimerase
MPGGLENIINYCKETGINSLELMSGDLERFLGAPVSPPRARPVPGQQFTPEELAAQQIERDKYTADLRTFRLGVTPDRVAAARKLFDDEGILIHTVKFSPGRWTSDEEIDYAFATAKAMGAKSVSDTISENAATRLAPFAEKHNMYVNLHSYGQFGQEGYAEMLMAISPAVMFNFDVGHHYGATGLDPCDFIRKYHARIFSIHLKDLTGPNTEPEPDSYQVFGQGETPLPEVLLLMKKEQWPIPVDIEMEYPVKPWSNQVKETKICVQYARNYLI